MEYLRSLWLQQKTSASSASSGSLLSSLDVVIMGAGRLGQSLVSFPSFSQHGVRVVGVFDPDPSKIGLRVSGLVVESPDVLVQRVQQKGVYRAIIAVPPPAAQSAADQLVEAGIRLILNYAPVNIRVPRAVVCERIDPGLHFARLAVEPAFVTSLLLDGSTEVPRLSATEAVVRKINPLYLFCGAYPGLEDLFTPAQETRSDLQNESFFLYLQREKGRISRNSSNQSLSAANADNVAKMHLATHGNSWGQENEEYQDQDQEQILTRQECRVRTPSPRLVELHLLPEDRPASAPCHASEAVSGTVCEPREPPEPVDLVGLEEPSSSLRQCLQLDVKGGFAFTGILLFGPPGSGKSSLLSLLTTEYKHCFQFLSVSAGDLASPSKIRAFFHLAKRSVGGSSPVVVLIDAVDTLCKSDRLKLALQSEMDRRGDSVLVVASTSLPWEIDMSLLRHFERRILVPLPNGTGRKEMFRRALTSRNLPVPPEEELTALASKTEGYSASDIVLVVKDALGCTQGSLSAINLAKSVMHVKPCISKEISLLYSSFLERFGHESPCLNASREKPPPPPYMSLYC